LAPELVESICTASERKALGGTTDTECGRHAKLLFSAKESAYKCQYPLSGCMMEFQDFDVTMDVGCGKFSAIFQRTVGPFAQGFALVGRFEASHGFIRTAVTLAA
jgi:4'-phosphopantetheinyl transferase EntD